MKNYLLLLDREGNHLSANALQARQEKLTQQV